MLRILSLLLMIALTLACGSKGSPTGPSDTTPSAATRIIVLDGGPLAFGAVTLGQSATMGFTIRNIGTAALTITGMTIPGNADGLAASWREGTIAPNGAQQVTVRFTPESTASFSGLVTVNGDQTSGTNTIAISGSGTLQGLPIFVHTGIGDAVFDMPRYVARVRITGAYTNCSSNFIVHIGGRLIVNELLGRCWQSTTYEGTLLTGGGGVVEIISSSGVHWTITEMR